MNLPLTLTFINHLHVNMYNSKHVHFSGQCIIIIQNMSFKVDSKSKLELYLCRDAEWWPQLCVNEQNTYSLDHAGLRHEKLSQSSLVVISNTALNTFTACSGLVLKPS